MAQFVQVIYQIKLILDSRLYDHIKVLIPTSPRGHETTIFLRTHRQHVVSDRDIWGKQTSDDPFQDSNIKFGHWSTCGQQELTKVAEIGKKRTFKNAHFWLKSRQIAVIFKFEYFHNEISYEVIRHGI